MTKHCITIAGIAHFLPERKVSNQEIIDAHQLKMKASWIEKNIGIRERRWAASDQAASDLAASAARSLDLQDFKGSLWISTISSDYFTPSTASIVKRKLGLAGDSPAFDLAAACAGNIFALETACHRLQATEEDEALVIATEVRSRYLNPMDRRTVFLFGDGAVAFLLRKQKTTSHGMIEWIKNSTRPSADYEILVPGGGSAQPLTLESLSAGAQYIQMNDGAKISEITGSTLVEEIHIALKKAGRGISDYDFFIFHQGNAVIANRVCTELGVSQERSWSNFNRYGNTSSASLGIALSEAVQEGKIKKGDRVLLVAMGAGYHLGMASIVWGLEGNTL